MNEYQCTANDEHSQGRCCHNCKWHISDRSHPSTDGGRVINQRGWICVGFIFMEGDPIAFSGWPEHGLCEIHEFIPNGEFVTEGSQT